MNKEFEEQINKLKKFNDNEITIIKNLQKITNKPIEALKDILKNYEKTDGKLLLFVHTLTIECIPCEYIYEYRIGNKIFEYSEGDPSFTFDNSW